MYYFKVDRKRVDDLERGINFFKKIKPDEMNQK